MKKIAFIAIVMLCGTAALVYAQDGGAVAVAIDNPVEVVSSAFSDIKAKNYTALASLLLMALAFYARKYAPSASFFTTFAGKLTLTIVAGLAAAVGEALVYGKLDLNSLISGLAGTLSAALAIAHPTPPAPVVPANPAPLKAV